MKIKDLIFPSYVLDKLIWKHHVSEREVRQIFRNKPMIRFLEKGRVGAENLYVALGQTDSGRYLSVFFIYKRNQKALIISARDMDAKERKLYGRK